MRFDYERKLMPPMRTIVFRGEPRTVELVPALRILRLDPVRALRTS